MLKNSIYAIIISFSMFLFTFSLPVLALETDDIINPEFEDELDMSKTDPQIIAARIIKVALSFLGIIAIFIIVYSGFEWMTAGGNDEKIKQAKKRLIAAIIGLIIILSAFAISQFIISSALTVVS